MGSMKIYNVPGYKAGSEPTEINSIHLLAAGDYSPTGDINVQSCNEGTISSYKKT